MTENQALPPPRPVDLVLRVSIQHSARGRLLEYRLHTPSGAVRGLSRNPHHSAVLGQPEAFHQDLIQELERLRDGLDVEDSALAGGEVESALKTLGQWLYHRLFPKSLREAYLDFRDQVQTLLVVSNEPWIPWEMIHPDEDDEDNFFCLRFEMGRWLTGAASPVVFKGVRRLACIAMGEQPTIDPSKRRTALPSANAEAEILRAFAHGPPKIQCLVPEDPTADDLLEILRDGIDWLHFAGHGEHRDPANPGNANAFRPELAKIELADRPLRARELSGDLADRLRRDRPVVFFNSCEGGRLGHALTGLGGWAQSWLEACHVSAFLAPFLSVNDGAARKFADILYREIHQGRSFGAAVRAARHKLRQANTSDDVAWLAYSFYGHPALHAARGEEGLRTASIDLVESPLELPEFRWRPDRSPPGALLRAEYTVVPFHFRQDEIEDLHAWCLSGENLGIRLYTGEGGMGKTRLALEICQRMRAEGWQAGLAVSEHPPEITWRDLCEIGGPRLLIVDYAETRRPFLAPLFRKIYQSEDKVPIRVLLLARAALDWWDHLRSEGDGVGELLSGPATRTISLLPLALSLEERTESYGLATSAFAEQLYKPLPERPPADLEEDHYKRVLLLHMRALAAIDGIEVKGEDGILDFVLGRERRFWGRLAVERELAREVADGIGRAMAAITLGGGVEDEEKAVLAMRGLAFFKDEKESVLTSVARLLRETYPGEGHWIEPITPDLLGEQLVMREMETNRRELVDVVLGTAAEG